MRFERIVVEGFGRLSGLDTGESPLPGLVGVHGPNEAGKTSLFHFLTAILYGFYPASREGNPYTPWSGDDIEGRAVLRLSDGQEWRIHRRLLSSPWGELSRNGTVEKLRNRELPCTEHVSLGLFRQVYALTLADLAGLEGESWTAVQDRLVGAMGATDLAPARETWRSLEDEASSLWRPDRRGKPRARELENRLRDLRERLREARDRDRELREKDRSLASLREELKETRLRRREVKAEIDRIQTLLPVRLQLRRIQELREVAGDPESLEDLPPDPGARLEELRERLGTLRHRRAALEERISRRERPAGEVSAGSRRILDAEEKIHALVSRERLLEEIRSRRAALEQALGETERRIRSHRGEVFDAAGTAPPGPDLIRDLPTGVLRERIREYRGAKEERLSREAARRWAPPSEAGEGDAWAAGALLGVGVLLLAVAATGGGGPILPAIGGPVTLLGALLLVLRLRKRSARAGGEALGDALEAARRREEEARRQVGDLLADLPVRRSHLEDPSLELPATLDRIRELLEDREERSRRLEEAKSDLAGIRERLATLGRELDLDLPDEPGPALHTLERFLRKAAEEEREARAASQEMERRREEILRLDQEIDEVRGDLEALESRLASQGGGDPDEGARRAGHRLKALTRARSILEELERTHPDLDELRSRIRKADREGASWTVEEDALARGQDAEEVLTERTEALARRISALETDIGHLRRGESADQVQGAVDAVKAELTETIRERDRLHVLALLVREADRRFREAHQPDLVRKAGAHLATITGGRYRAIRVGEVDGRETFFLEGPGYPHALEVDEPISRGTREQVYLALRLAIVDHLDEGAETLPLFVDEAFVNWDRARRTRGLDLLAELARDRQIFVFTCHQETARALEARGGRIVELSGDP